MEEYVFVKQLNLKQKIKYKINRIIFFCFSDYLFQRISIDIKMRLIDIEWIRKNFYIVPITTNIENPKFLFNLFRKNKIKKDIN